ncbi:hypothetical protein HDU99_006300 [Rhizoclosmatium hyalinum]|nr:hypothetical protein HDU99_006300 [Rhizoclosmatium hyalinum]
MPGPSNSTPNASQTNAQFTYKDSIKSSAPVSVVYPTAIHTINGAGSLTFSNAKLLCAIVTVPIMTTLMLRISIAWLPVVLAFTALPTFAVYNVWYATIAEPVRIQKGLEGKDKCEYLIVKDKSLAQKYPTRIPMETFCEAYFDEKIDLVNGKDLLYVMEHRYEWASFVFTWGNAKFFLTQWIPETLWHSKVQDETQVREHYDRGDDFYNWFLGPSMTYTTGTVSDSTRPETLEEMQTNKMNMVCDKINLQPGDRLLDIGCGWGTFSVHAAKRGASVTGVTLGRNQTAWGTEQAIEAGVSDRVKFLCMDYRDIPKEKYDKITCVEMSEHVGVRNYQNFLVQVREMLEDDGIFYLQIVGLRRAWQYEDLIWGLFMAKYVFPGADASAPLNWVLEQCERAGFEVAHTDNLGVHYSATIHRWYLNWIQNKENVISKYGVRWFRVWEMFLAWATIIPRQGSATAYSITLHKSLNQYNREPLHFSKRTQGSVDKRGTVEM